MPYEAGGGYGRVTGTHVDEENVQLSSASDPDCKKGSQMGRSSCPVKTEPVSRVLIAFQHPYARGFLEKATPVPSAYEVLSALVNRVGVHRSISAGRLPKRTAQLLPSHKADARIQTRSKCRPLRTGRQFSVRLLHTSDLRTNIGI